MIELKNLGKTFHTKEQDIIALRDINLTIEDGEIFGIIGLSGAGKSTVMSILEDSGYFCVDNKDSSSDHLVFNRSVSLKDSFKAK